MVFPLSGVPRGLCGWLGLLLSAFACIFWVTNDAAEQATPLRVLVDENFPEGNVVVGGTAGYRQIDGQKGQILSREFGYITPENEFKQSYVRPTPESWSWEAPDGWVEFAERHGQLVRLHAPIGPQCSPWAKEDDRTAEELEPILREYLRAICLRYRGHPQVRWLDVINETVNSDGSWKGPEEGVDQWELPWEKIGYRTVDPEEFPALGGRIPLYIIYAFEEATEHGGDLKLIVNQHAGMEQPMWERIKDMIRYLRSEGFRVDGLGWQAHIRLSREPENWETGKVDQKELDRLIRWAHDNDLEFHVTELNLHARDDERNDRDLHAEVIGSIFDTVLRHRDNGRVGINFWSLTEEPHYRAKHLTTLGLWDPQGRATPAYWRVHQMLSDPPPPVP